jgi:hypothetical protein
MSKMDIPGPLNPDNIPYKMPDFGFNNNFVFVDREYENQNIWHRMMESTFTPYNERFKNYIKHVN